MLLRLLTLIGLLGAFLFAPLTAHPAAAAEELVTYHLTHAGQERTYHVHVPADYDAAQPTPLIVVLHPFASSGKAMAALTGFDAVADAHGALVVYPDSFDLAWDEGRQAIDPDYRLPAADDVGFIAALLDDVAEHYAVDPARVSMTGFANGGLLAYRLACDLPERFSRVAVDAATFWNYHPDLCGAEGAPVNLLVVLGTADITYPAEGRAVGTLEENPDHDAMRILPLAATRDFWLGRNACPEEPSTETDMVVLYTGCAEDTSLAIFTPEGVGHHWPRVGDYTLNQFGLDLTELIARYLLDDGDWLELAHTTLPAEDAPPTPRSYMVYVPPNYDPATPMPVVFALHGRPGNGAGLAYLLDGNRIAREEGFILVYPDGVDYEWNSTRGFQGFESSGMDDTAFLTALVADLGRDLNLDRERVYVFGFSNGGFMTQRLACEASETFAGFSFVGASLFIGFTSTCEGTPPVPVLYMHGTLDAVVSWEGITQGNLVLYLSALDTTYFWLTHNGCAVDDANHEVLGEPAPDATTYAHRFTFDGCPPHGTVEFVTIEGGGHNLPGVTGRLDPQIAGRTNLDINTMQVLWEFFSQHTLHED